MGQGPLWNHIISYFVIGYLILEIGYLSITWTWKGLWGPRIWMNLRLFQCSRCYAGLYLLKHTQKKKKMQATYESRSRNSRSNIRQISVHPDFIHHHPGRSMARPWKAAKGFCNSSSACIWPPLHVSIKQVASCLRAFEPTEPQNPRCWLSSVSIAPHSQVFGISVISWLYLDILGPLYPCSSIFMYFVGNSQTNFIRWGWAMDAH